MPSLSERLRAPEPGLCFYGLAPPKRATPLERLAAIASAQLARLGDLQPDGLVIYDLQDEPGRVHGPRPFPFLPPLEPEQYAYGALASAKVHRIVYRSAAAMSRASFVDRPPAAVFAEFWDCLARFVDEDPIALRFLELQDHTPYLDAASRQRELAVLAPIALACLDFQRRGALRSDTTPDVIIATLWGAFVGLVKAARLGYLKLTPRVFASARAACWRAFAADPAPPPARRTRWKPSAR